MKQILILIAFTVLLAGCPGEDLNVTGGTTNTVEVTQTEFSLKVDGGVLYVREVNALTTYCMSYANVGITYPAGWITIERFDQARMASGLAPYTNVELDACA